MRRYRMAAIVLAAALILSGCSKLGGGDKTPGTPGVTQEETVPETGMIKIEQTEAPETSAVEPETTAAEEITGAKETTEAAETTAATTAAKETEAAKVYQVTAMQKTMYATQPVHVRKSYTKQSDVITSLGTGQKVEVTGMAANGWIRIVYHGQDAYVYKAYLSEDKTETREKSSQPAKETQAPEQESQHATETGGQSNIPVVVPSPGSSQSNQSQGSGSNGNVVTGISGGPGVNLDPGLTSGPGGNSSLSSPGTGIVSSVGPGGI